MKFKLSAKSFLAGLITGLVLLSIIGSRLRPPHLTGEFKRFHIADNSRNFYPTGGEIKAIIDHADKNKIIVIVGGTSVLQGTGQEEGRVWTDHLQKQLGNDYVVINFALRSGGSNELGNLAVEMLLKEQRRVIYVCDSMLGQFVIPIHSAYYTPICFDTWQQGYLLSWKPRDQLMESAFWDSSSKLKEVAWGSLLNRYLNFKDVWNYVTYEYAGTVWNSEFALKSFIPLRDVADPEHSPAYFRAQRYPKGAEDELCMNRMRWQMVPDDSPLWKNIRIDTEAQIPPAVRDVSMVIVNLNSPFYMDRLTAVEKQSFRAQGDHMAGVLKQMGFRKVFVAVDGFTEDDYIDRVHLSVSGGEKLGAIVAPQVRSQAKELGYLK